MPEPSTALKVSLDLKRLQQQAEEALTRIARAGAGAILDAAGNELSKAQGLVQIAKQIIKPPKK
jgi:hypothetical protein